MKKTTSWSFVAAAAGCAAVFTVGQIDDADARGGGRGGGVAAVAAVAASPVPDPHRRVGCPRADSAAPHNAAPHKVVPDSAVAESVERGLRRGRGSGRRA